MLRTFIAIELTQEIQKKLAEFAGAVENTQDKIAWVLPKNIHLTIKFLGDLEESYINSVTDIMADVCGKCPPFEITIKGAGAFPSEKKPRVMWVGVTEGSDMVKGIYSRLEEGLVSIGILKEDRGFTAHITLGRVKYIKDTRKFAEVLSKDAEYLIGNMRVEGVSLIKSTLTSSGSVYETLYKAMLKG